MYTSFPVFIVDLGVIDCLKKDHANYLRNPIMNTLPIPLGFLYIVITVIHPPINLLVMSNMQCMITLLQGALITRTMTPVASTWQLKEGHQYVGKQNWIRRFDCKAQPGRHVMTANLQNAFSNIRKKNIFLYQETVHKDPMNNKPSGDDSPLSAILMD